MASATEQGQIRALAVAPACEATALSATLRSLGIDAKCVRLWSGAGTDCPAPVGKEAGPLSVCVDGYLLGAVPLQDRIAQCAGSCSDVLLCVSDSVITEPLLTSGLLVVVRTPHVPQDVVVACQQSAASLPAGYPLKAVVCLDPSPSLTPSVLQKALESAGLPHVSKNTFLISPGKGQAAQSAATALLHLCDHLPLVPPVPSPYAGGDGARIAVARDAAFSPRFTENLAALASCGAQIVFFSPLYDAALPAGTAGLYLCGGPVDAEHWEQLSSNRQLVGQVNAFCSAGGCVLAEGAGLLYLSRSVEASDGCNRRVYETAGVLPFKTSLMPAAATGNVQLRILGGNPLFPAGSAARGFLCSQAGIIEERVVTGLCAPQSPEGEESYRTTYVASVQQPQEGSASSALPDAPEGYTVNSVLASNVFVYLPSADGLAAHMVEQCSAVDAYAVGLALEQALLRDSLQHGKATSVASSRAVSRRQSIQDLGAASAWAHHGYQAGARFSPRGSHSCDAVAGSYNTFPAAPCKAEGLVNTAAVSTSQAEAPASPALLPHANEELASAVGPWTHSHHSRSDSNGGGVGGSPQPGSPRAALYQQQRSPSLAHGSGQALAPGQTHQKLLGVSCPLVLPIHNHAAQRGSQQRHSSACQLQQVAEGQEQLAGTPVAGLCRAAPGAGASGFAVDRAASASGGHGGPAAAAAHGLVPSRMGRNSSSGSGAVAASVGPVGRPPLAGHQTRFSQDLPPLPHGAAHPSYLPRHASALALPGAAGADPAHSVSALARGLGTLAVPCTDGVACFSPAACEALVAMGLGSRLVGISKDCDYPADICASRRVMAAWRMGSAQQGGGTGALRGLQGPPLVTASSDDRPSTSTSIGASARGLPAPQQLLLDEAGLMQERPSVIVLPSLEDLEPYSIAKLQQALLNCGLAPLDGSGTAVLHMSCATLCDVMDAMQQLGWAAGVPEAAASLLERLQGRVRRLAVAAAAVGMAERPRVMVLTSLQPLVEPGRWVPELVSLAGGAPLQSAPGGADAVLSWQDVRQRAPEVLVVVLQDGPAGAEQLQHMAALAALPGWWSLPAVRNSQVYLVQAPYLLRPGPRLLDGAELLARLTSPAFKAQRKAPQGVVMKLSLAAGQRCRATLLPTYFVPFS